MASNTARTPTHQASGSGPDWAAEARRLAHADLGGAPWITDLSQRVAQAADDDLGTLVVARAALTKAAAEHAAEMARQRSQRAAELARVQQAEAARLQRERREAEEAQQREKRARREHRARDTGVDEVMGYIYLWSLVASGVYSYWVSTTLQVSGWTVFFSCLVPLGLAFLLDCVAEDHMTSSWRYLFGFGGAAAGWYAYSSSPYLSPWLVGGSWVLGQLIEVATSVKALRE